METPDATTGLTVKEFVERTKADLDSFASEKPFEGELFAFFEWMKCFAFVASLDHPTRRSSEDGSYYTTITKVTGDEPVIAQVDAKLIDHGTGPVVSAHTKWIQEIDDSQKERLERELYDAVVKAVTTVWSAEEERRNSRHTH